MVIITDIAGGEWPERARAAALKLTSIDNATSSDGTEILASIKEIFEHKQIDRISSVD